MNVISHDPPAKDPALRLAIWVRSGIDGTVIRLCFWDGVERGHGHADYLIAPGFVIPDGFTGLVPKEAIGKWTGGHHYYVRVGDECLMPTNGILPDGTFSSDILAPDGTIHPQGTITSKEYEEKYRPLDDGVPGTMTKEEEERYRRLGAMPPQRIRRMGGKV